MLWGCSLSASLYHFDFWGIHGKDSRSERISCQLCDTAASKNWVREQAAPAFESPLKKALSDLDNSPLEWPGFSFPKPQFLILCLKLDTDGTSLGVQWLGLWVSTAAGTGLIPSWGTKILQAKIKQNNLKKRKRN